MHRRYQRGELSLFRSAVVIGAVALAGMVALMSVRYERNYFVAAWEAVAGRFPLRAAVQAEQALSPAAPARARPILRCVVDGRVLYSNVECDPRNPGSRRLELEGASGIEAPGGTDPPAASGSTSGPDGQRLQLIEPIVRH